ncbi:MAG: PadR family transcriptional regulator [Candidatus Woesearchaeota archaeon]
MERNLKLLVLHLLSEQELSGYGIIKEIDKHTGWKPSYGSIYPFLKQAQKNGWLRQKIDKRRKLYSITGKGKKELVDFAKKRSQFMDHLMQNLKSINLYSPELMLNKGDMSFMIDICQNLKDEKLPLKGLMKDVFDMKYALLKLYAGKRIEPNKDKIKKILSRTTKELKALK